MTMTEPTHIDIAEARTVARTERDEAWRADVERMSEILNDAADRANLCSDYEAAIDQVNRTCTLVQLLPRAREYSATITVVVRLTCREDEAGDRAREAADTLCRADGGTIWSSSVEDWELA